MKIGIHIIFKNNKSFVHNQLKYFNNKQLIFDKVANNAL